MSGECDICGVMGCVESNHKETNVTEQTPAQIAAAIVRRELDAYYVSPRPMSQQAERFDLREAIADAIREAQTSGAASRDGEVGRLREALVSIAEYWNGSGNERAMLDACQYASDTARSALAPGNGGEEP